MIRTISTVLVCFAVLCAGLATAATPEQKCQAGKNRAAGKYVACRHNAEKGLALKGDVGRYGDAIVKCETKFAAAWQKEEDRATAAGATCLDAPLLEGNFQTALDEHTDIIAVALAGGGLVDCPSDLAVCTGDLATCNGSLGSCNASYAACSADLGTCTANYASCSSSLATCSAGTATSADVIVGKTFSSSAGIGATGTMPNNGSWSVVPGTGDTMIPLGFHDGAGVVAGDGDLLAANIKLGVDLFGVTGTLGCGNGNIDAGEQCDQNDLNGETCATQGYAFGTLQCGADCVLDTSGCYAVRFTDNGDGTITDASTGLMWEKKGGLDGVPVACTSAVVCPDPHDADNQYTYSFDNPLGPPGTAYTVLLAQLNSGGGFAGHTDWRLPTREELETIADYADASSPVVDAVFDTGCTGACTPTACSCTAPSGHWTDDLVASVSGNAWLVDFSDGSVLHDTRDTDYNVRAVR